jgi:hypothetical protein
VWLLSIGEAGVRFSLGQKSFAFLPKLKTAMCIFIGVAHFIYISLFIFYYALDCATDYEKDYVLFNFSE